MNQVANIIQLYSEQLSIQEPLFIMDDELNVILMNNQCINMLNKLGISLPKVNNVLSWYEDIENDITNLKYTTNLQVVRYIAHNSFYRVNLHFINNSHQKIIVIYLQEIHDKDVINLFKRNVVDKTAPVLDKIKLFSDKLNTMELEVLKLLLLGYKQKLITMRLNISRTKLNNLYANIANKLFNKELSSKKIKEIIHSNILHEGTNLPSCIN